MPATEAKPGVTPRDIAIILGAVVAVALAIFMITRTLNQDRVRDVIVIKGAKGAKPMGDEMNAPLKEAADAAPSDASDKPIKLP